MCPVAFDVYLSGGTDQCLRVFGHVLHFVRPPTVVLAILWLFPPSLFVGPRRGVRLLSADRDDSPRQDHLFAGACFTEGYTPDLHYRLMETWALRPASDLARSLLSNCIDQEDLPATNTESPASRRRATGQRSS